MICQRLCLAIFALSIAYASSRDVDVVAQGSVGHVFPAETAISTVEKPLVANMSDLWCQAFRNSAQKTEVLDAARFVHITGLQTHTAEMRNNHMQAYLHFRNAPLTVAGKYKCNLTTAGGENVYGNMFIYMRPVFHDSSKNIEFVEEDKNFTVIAKPVYSSRESTVVLRCPVLGYPKPTIKWFKDPEMKETDSVEIEYNDKMKLVSGTDLEIHNVDSEDEGVYRCEASNKFSTLIDEGPEFTFQSTLKQQLYVSTWGRWILPLILIILMIILLVLIIYCCAFCKRRMKHSDNYDVAKREKTMGAIEKQRLQEDYDADD